MKKTIGFIGTGVMGASMVRNLIKSGFKVLVYNRSKEKTKCVVDDGAICQDSIAQLAANSEIVITMVGYPKDVEEVYLGENGILNNAKEGTYLIDMTTSSPLLAKKIHEKATEKGLYALDAPVSGGDIGAQKGTLSIMIGGNKEHFETIKAVLGAMGNNIVYQGEAGAGQYTKMCNQITLASNMVGVCEAISYGAKAGLDPTVVLKSIETGAAGSWSLTNLAPRMIAGDFEPGFYVKHIIKDLTIALESSRKLGLSTPGLELAKSLYEKLAEMGEENSGTQALYKLYME